MGRARCVAFFYLGVDVLETIKPAAAKMKNTRIHSEPHSPEHAPGLASDYSMFLSIGMEEFPAACCGFFNFFRGP